MIEAKATPMMLYSDHPRPWRRPGSTLLSTLVLATIAVVAAVAIVVGLILLRWFFQGDPTYEFLYRRLEETFGWAAVLTPVAFAFVVLWTILFLRQPTTLRQMFTAIGFPKFLSDLVLVWMPLTFCLTFLL